MSYDRFERWLAAHCPHILANLQPPATDAELAMLRDRIGATLPDALIRLYRWKNGQRELRRAGPFYGLAFLSIHDALNQWEAWKSLADDDPEYTMEPSGTSVVPGVVKEVYVNLSWIPFAYDWGGNHIGVDLDPGPNGRVGQVINFGRDEDTRFVLGATVDDFIERIVTELEADNFVPDDEPDDPGFNTRNPPSGHFLDSAREWFGAA
jgi:cell wall assembly regulator SMI1